MNPAVSVSKTIVRIGASVALLVGSGLSACATTGAGGVTSPYFQPEDGYLYKYGNFCGPGWPNYPGPTPQDNIAFLESIEPVDDIDRACRAHDRCYFEYGADNKQCDLMLAELLRDHGMGQTLLTSRSSFLENEFSAQCANLAGEIMTAVGQFKQGDYIASLIGDTDAARQARTEAALMLGFNALRNVAGGWPEVPGLCFFSDDQRAASGSPAAQALIAAASAMGYSAPSSLTLFEPFYPASDASLEAGRMALIARRAALEAAAASASESVE